MNYRWELFWFTVFLIFCVYMTVRKYDLSGWDRFQLIFLLLFLVLIAFVGPIYLIIPNIDWICTYGRS